MINCLHDPHQGKMAYLDEKPGDCCARHFTYLVIEKKCSHRSSDKVVSYIAQEVKKIIKINL